MKDSVDDFLDQWQRERPDLDTGPMGLVGRIFAREGIESWEFDVLATLRRSGPPYTLSPSDLVASTMVGSAAMTNRVDKLVSRNLVTREVDPNNRRRLLVSLTPEGLALVDEVVEGHVANERTLVGGLTASDREELAELLRKLLVSLGDTSIETNGAAS
jgi:DNA-binding MarR family transcriptional regulator